MASSRKLPSIDIPGRDITTSLAGCLDRHVLAGDSLVAGLSGGIDSVVMLHALASLAPGKLVALHVNHGLSPRADEWADFCATYAHALGLPFRCLHVNVERGSADGLEAAARRARHAVFAASPEPWVVLAHQREDQAETLLFNLLRGCGLAGAAAMRERNGKLLRPLLSIGRAGIAAYAARHSLRWIDDESNADLRFSRNYLRHRVFAPLSQRFPAAAGNLAGAAARFAEALELLDQLALADLCGNADFPLSVAVLTALDESRARNALRFLLAQRNVQVPSEARLREAVQQMRTAGADRHPRVSLGAFQLVRRRGLIYLEPSCASC